MVVFTALGSTISLTYAIKLASRGWGKGGIERRGGVERGRNVVGVEF